MTVQDVQMNPDFSKEGMARVNGRKPVDME